MLFGHQETRSEELIRQMKQRASDVAEAMPSVEISDVQAAHALGWVSLAIGAAEVAAPQMVEGLLGLPHDKDRQGAIRVLGVRELGHGLSILAEDRPNTKLAASLWGRVAGDILDTVALGKAMQHTKTPRQFLAVSAIVAAIGAADLWCATRLSADA